MKATKLVLLTLAVLGTVRVLPAVAVPITYDLDGCGRPSLDGVPIGNGLVCFSIHALGDTDNVESCGAGCFSNDNLWATIGIENIGTLTFITGTRFFSNFGGGFGFSRAGIDGLDLFHGPLPGWDMRSSIGIFGAGGLLLQWDLGDVLTDSGVLFFNDGETGLIFSAIVSASRTRLTRAAWPRPRGSTICATTALASR